MPSLTVLELSAAADDAPVIDKSIVPKLRKLVLLEHYVDKSEVSTFLRALTQLTQLELDMFTWYSEEATLMRLPHSLR